MINQLEKNSIYEYFLEKVSEIYKVAPNIFSQKDGNDFSDYRNTLEYSAASNLAFDLDLEIQYGATKIVFIDLSDDYVLKVPMGKVDFCAIEVENYTKISIKYPEYAKYLAECWYAGNFSTDDGEIPMYIMQRADIDPEKVSDISYKSYISNNPDDPDGDEYYWDESDIAYDCLYIIYGDVVSDLYEIFDEFDINDIHTSNIGFIAGGKPVVIDYSGFY